MPLEWVHACILALPEQLAKVLIVGECGTSGCAGCWTTSRVVVVLQYAGVPGDKRPPLVRIATSSRSMYTEAEDWRICVAVVECAHVVRWVAVHMLSHIVATAASSAGGAVSWMGIGPRTGNTGMRYLVSWLHLRARRTMLEDGVRCCWSKQCDGVKAESCSNTQSGRGREIITCYDAPPSSARTIKPTCAIIVSTSLLLLMLAAVLVVYTFERWAQASKVFLGHQCRVVVRPMRLGGSRHQVCPCKANSPKL